jgi:hypothetical protein
MTGFVEIKVAVFNSLLYALCSLLSALFLRGGLSLFDRSKIEELEKKEQDWKSVTRKSEKWKITKG